LQIDKTEITKGRNNMINISLLIAKKYLGAKNVKVKKNEFND